MNPPSLMTPAEIERYAAGLSRLARQIKGRVGEYLTSAAKDLRSQTNRDNDNDQWSF